MLFCLNRYLECSGKTPGILNLPDAFANASK